MAEGLAGVDLLAHGRCVGHPDQSDGDEHDHDNYADSHVRIADYGEVVEAYRGLFGGGESVENQLAGGIAHFRKEVREHNERGHGHA